MDLHQFNFQDQKSQTELIWQHGTFICFREEGENTIALYEMGQFFAEVWYNAAMDEIKLARGFRSTKCLEPYLNEIEISIP